MSNTGQSGLGNSLQQGNGNRTNYNWQFRMLQELGIINSSIVATMGRKDFEVWMVRDTGNSDFLALEILRWNPATGTFDPPIYQTPTGAPYVPVGPLEYVDDSSLLSLILAELTTIAAYLAPVQDTPGLQRVTNAGTIAAGRKGVSVYNAGLADGVWLGVAIKPGEQFSYTGSPTLGAFAYDGTGTELVITTTV